MGDNKPGGAASTSNGSPSYTVDARVIRFRQELRSNTINLTDVSKLAYEGVPDKYGLRPLVWKVCFSSPCIATAHSTLGVETAAKPEVAYDGAVHTYTTSATFTCAAPAGLSPR